jgi:archaellum biogenesis ATPase FlaH
MTNSVEPKIIDTTYYSDGFPVEQWDSLIPRSNYISQLEDGIASGLNIFFIEGEEDSGKTTLVAQFVKKYVDSTISVFFNPLNNLDYQIDYFCTNIVLQISHLLNEEISIEKTRLISTEQYRQSLYQLRKFLKKNRNKVNLVIDGLETKVKEDPEFVKSLFSILPLGEDYFRIIISGSKAEFVSTYTKLKKAESKAITLTGFTDSDILKYLESNESILNTIRDLYKVTKGYPGRLKTLKRLIKSDEYSLEQISGNTTYNSWLELDCESVDLAVSQNNVIISLLTLTDHSYSVGDIAKICLLGEIEVKRIIQSLEILDKSERNVSITSSAHKRYLSNLLRGNKTKVDELLISFYAQTDTLNSLIDLPKLYSVKKEWGKVIEPLDEKYIDKILERTGSLKIVNETLGYGSKRISEISNYLVLGNKLPLHEVFPVYMYYLNNCTKTYKSVKDGSLSTIQRDNFKEAVNATNLIQILSQKKKITEKSYRKFFIDEEFSTNKPVKPKSREAAFNFIREWLKDQAAGFLIIADPYFEKEDLEILKIIKEINDTIDIDILGSIYEERENLEVEYKNHWREISDEEPPFVNITFCRLSNSAETPFHDRWIITKNSGLRLGTSINSLGIKKESEISVMKPNEALRIREDTLIEFITRRKKDFNNQRLNYKSFTL